MLRVLLFTRICKKKAEERLSCETYVLTSKGEMQGTIYSGEKIQSFVCCSTVIKQRRFQRMYSMCDFQNSTVVFPILSSEVETLLLLRQTVLFIIHNKQKVFQIEGFSNFVFGHRNTRNYFFYNKTQLFMTAMREIT